jgi:hypothetical protein
MQATKQDPTAALVVVVKALEPLPDADRQWVQSAASRWSIIVQGPAANSGVLSSNASGGSGQTHGGASSTDIESAIAKKDVRAFIRLKRPNTDVQRVACLGYFLVRTTGNHGSSSKDVSKAHTDSGGSKINMTRALDNATRQAKYLSNRGPREKQLTTLGEDIVVALPQQQALKEIESAAKGRGKARAKKKSKTKG